jgi:hypothetical protein
MLLGIYPGPTISLRDSNEDVSQQHHTPHLSLPPSRGKKIKSSYSLTIDSRWDRGNMDMR